MKRSYEILSLADSSSKLDSQQLGQVSPMTASSSCPC
jgi:hypothetical protein